MKIKSLFLAFLGSVLLYSCGPLKPATSTNYSSLEGYTYVYITPTAAKEGSSGAVYGNQYGVYGGVTNKTTSPSDVISGYFIKKGFVIIPELKQEVADKTVIINYGETGRRSRALGYTIEVTIQILDAKTLKVLRVGTAEGQGDTEADDIRIAIGRCLEKMLE